MKHPSLFKWTPAAANLHCFYVVGEGWRVRWAIRQTSETWLEADHDEFDALVPAELIDVLDVFVTEMQETFRDAEEG